MPNLIPYSTHNCKTIYPTSSYSLLPYTPPTKTKAHYTDNTQNCNAITSQPTSSLQQYPFPPIPKTLLKAAKTSQSVSIPFPPSLHVQVRFLIQLYLFLNHKHTFTHISIHSPHSYHIPLYNLHRHFFSSRHFFATKRSSKFTSTSYSSKTSHYKSFSTYDSKVTLCSICCSLRPY